MESEVYDTPDDIIHGTGTEVGLQGNADTQFLVVSSWICFIVSFSSFPAVWSCGGVSRWFYGKTQHQRKETPRWFYLFLPLPAVQTKWGEPRIFMLEFFILPPDEKFKKSQCFSLTRCCLQGYLITWTKRFKASGVEGMDVVQLLDKAIKKRAVSLISSEWSKLHQINCKLIPDVCAFNCFRTTKLTSWRWWTIPWEPWWRAASMTSAVKLASSSVQHSLRHWAQKWI